MQVQRAITSMPRVRVNNLFEKFSNSLRCDILIFVSIFLIKGLQVLPKLMLYWLCDFLHIFHKSLNYKWSNNIYQFIVRPKTVRCWNAFARCELLPTAVPDLPSHWFEFVLRLSKYFVYFHILWRKKPLQLQIRIRVETAISTRLDHRIRHWTSYHTFPILEWS